MNNSVNLPSEKTLQPYKGYGPKKEELKKSYLTKYLKQFLFVNMLILPCAYSSLFFLVFFSRNKIVYELLSNKEKIQYIFLYGNKITFINSAIFLPMFADINSKHRLTSKPNLSY